MSKVVRRLAEIPAGSWTKWVVMGFWLVVVVVAAPPGLPAHRLTQCPVHAGQLGRRQATQVVLDHVKPKICLISHSSFQRHASPGAAGRVPVTDNGGRLPWPHRGNPVSRHVFSRAGGHGTVKSGRSVSRLCVSAAKRTRT